MATATGSRLLGGLGAAVVVGGFIAGQARINGELGHEIGDGLVAAFISFSAGLLLMVVLATTIPAGRRGLRRAVAAGPSGRLRPWQYFGGVGGALLVASQGLTTALLGTALFTIAVVAGQSTGGLVVDRVGLGPAGPQATTLPRVAGALLMLGAVVLSVAPSLHTSAPVVLAILPLVAGAALALQQAANGQVAAAAGEVDERTRDTWVASVLAAGTTNFLVGMVTLAIASGVSVAVRGWPASFPGEPWLYLGGPCGAIFVALAAWTVGRIGVLLLALGSVAGQVVTAVVLDTVAPPAAGRPGLTTVLGAVLTLVAAGVASLPTRDRSPAAQAAEPGAADLP